MKLMKSLTPSRILILGSINGLLVGLIIEQVRIAYLNYQRGKIMREYAQSDWAVDFVNARWEGFIPLICIVVFAVVGHLIYRYFMNRPRALLLTWAVMGVVALWAGYFMSTLSPNFFSIIWIMTIAMVSYLVHRFWKNHVHSVFLLWLVIGISAVIVVVFGVQLIGLLFYWPELRSSLTWLLCFGIVVVINSVYGAVIQLLFSRYYRIGLKHTGA